MATRRYIKPRSTFERYAFLFMRLSGIGLLLLAVGHMLLQHIFRDVHNLTLQVVQDVWRSWGWRAWDLLLLALATAHGFNGLRTILEDYVHSKSRMKLISRALAVFLVLTIAWAAVAIFSFRSDAILASAN